MVVTGENANAGSRLPVPYANCLIVGSGKHPRVLVVENCCADVIQMTQKSEDASLLLVVPDLKKPFQLVMTNYL